MDLPFFKKEIIMTIGGTNLTISFSFIHNLKHIVRHNLVKKNIIGSIKDSSYVILVNWNFVRRTNHHVKVNVDVNSSGHVHSTIVYSNSHQNLVSEAEYMNVSIINSRRHVNVWNTVCVVDVVNTVDRQKDNGSLTLV